MTTVQDILSFLNQLASPQDAMPWDHTGFQLGNRNIPVTKILVALDPFEEACREAADFGAQLLVTHHPLLFTPTSDLTEDTPTGRCVKILIANGISQWSGHTNLDVAPNGVNDVLAEKLGLSDVEILPPENLLRAGVIPETPLADFLSSVKTALGCPGLRYVDGGKPCRRVAVGGGACGSGLPDAAAAGCDTFVTSDIKYNQFRDAFDLGINLIDAGHFYTENPVCSRLAEAISGAFPDVTVKISQKHRDCMKFF